MEKSNKRLWWIVAVVVVVIILIVSLSKNNPSSDTKEKVRIGYLNLLTSAPLYVAENKGFFEREGLEVELVKLSSANEAYEALARGDIDFVPSTGILPVLINAPKVGGVVKIASASSLVGKMTFDKLITLNDKISQLTDLKGKKIGIFPGTTPTTFLKIFLKSKGVDVDSITFIQIPPENQLAALESGSIDALFGYEPVPTIEESKNTKVKVLASDVLAEVFPGSPLGARLTTDKFMCQRNAVYEKVQKVFDDAQDVIKNDRNTYVSVVSERLSISPEIVGKLTPYFTYDVNKETLASFEDFLVKNGELKEKTNLAVLTECSSN